MKLKYLGTAAAEAIPAIFCSCATCIQARATGGKDIRSRNQALINDDLIIDYPPDSFSHGIQNNIDFSGIYNYLITHTHGDHFVPEEWGYVEPPFSDNPKDWPQFNLYGSIELKEKCDKSLNYIPKPMTLNVLEAYESVKIGKYTVIPIKASHSTSNPFCYAISDGNKSILYLHDTGFIFDEAYECFKKNGICFDIVSIDCTEGSVEEMEYYGHMCLGRGKIIRERLRKEGLVHDNTKYIMSHFSHGGKDVNYEESHRIYEKEGFIMAYDGLEVEA